MPKQHSIQIADWVWRFYQEEFGVDNPARWIREEVLGRDVADRQSARAVSAAHRDAGAPTPEQETIEDDLWNLTEIVVNEPGTYHILKHRTRCSLRDCKAALPTGRLVWMVTCLGYDGNSIFCTSHMTPEQVLRVQKQHLLATHGRPRAV